MEENIPPLPSNHLNQSTTFIFLPGQVQKYTCEANPVIKNWWINVMVSCQMLLQPPQAERSPTLYSIQEKLPQVK